MTALVGIIFAGAWCSAEPREQDTISTAQLKKRSLEELLDMDISVVSKRAEPISGVAAYVQVVTGNELTGSAATTLPEAMRLVPGSQVAQLDSRQWAISSRGFNGTSTNNKLLVMIDGRSVYTPLFSGVFWDAQDIFMDDLDRIEVISGPGGSLWGTNAVNGVFNILSKSSLDRSTHGLLLQAGGGTSMLAQTAARYGGSISNNGAARGYVKFNSHDASRFANGDKAADSWKRTQGGFRADWDLVEGTQLTVQGDAYGGSIDHPTLDNTKIQGGNILGRWTRRLTERSNLRTQAYYDYTYRNIPGVVAERLHTFDGDFQHHVKLSKRHNIVWGAGYRLYLDRVTNTPAVAFIPSDLTFDILSGFIHDEIILADSSIRLTLGSKFEHNDFSGFEHQPTIRASWSLANRQTVWAAVSRSVRTPSRVDRDLFLPGNPPHTTLSGGQGFVSEKLLTFEGGYRVRPWTNVFLHAVAFYNIYDDLRSVEPGPPPYIANGLEGETLGGSVGLDVQPLKWWIVRADYTHFEQFVRLKSASRDTRGGRSEGNDPRHQGLLHSSMDLTEDIQMNLFARVVDGLNNVNPPVPSYAAFDVAIHWRPMPQMTLSVLGQNLPNRRHPEFGAVASRREISRSIHAKITYRP